MFWAIYFISGLVTASFAGWLAREKSRSYWGWAALGFAFNFIGLIAISGAPVKSV